MRVLIVDADPRMRKAVRSTIGDFRELEIVGEAGDGREALLQTQQLRPNLIIMDILIPLLDGLSAAAHIMMYHPQIKILLFSTHTVRDFIETAKELGLSGYVPKDENGPALRDAIDAVLHGRTYFPTDAPEKASGTSAT